MVKLGLILTIFVTLPILIFLYLVKKKKHSSIMTKEEASIWINETGEIFHLRNRKRGD